MGMSIDESEALEILKDIRLNANYIQNRESRTGMACKLAISTMRKYQKIVGIVSLNDEEFKQCGLKELKEILEVIADGNVD